MSYTMIRFTVRNKGGALGGQTLEHEIPEFDWDKFKNTPNAEVFAKKAYLAAAQKNVRELYEKKNYTEEHHLHSMENLIAHSIKYTREEIEDWCECRDWSQAKFTIDSAKGIQFLKEHLPALSTMEFSFPENLRARAAEIVAEVAYSKSDPIAEYLFVKLTQVQKEKSLIDLI